MSLIMDALNRADQERTDEQPTPSLLASQTPTLATQRPWKRWLIEALLVVAACAVLAFSLWKNQSQPNTALPAGEKANITANTTETTPTDNNAGAAEPPTAVVAEQPPVTKKPAVAKESSPELTAKPAPPADSAAIAKLYQQPAQKRRETAKPKPQAATPAPETEQPTQNDGLSILQQIPLLSERSLRFQQQVPNMEYSVHVYAEDSGSGFVVINGSRQRVGSQIVPELRLIAILKDSVVLDYRGTQFRLSALNSWINF